MKIETGKKVNNFVDWFYSKIDSYTGTNVDKYTFKHLT